jgi:hypothetical protein
MKEIQMYTHFFKDYPFVESNWYKALSNNPEITTPKSEIIKKNNKKFVNLDDKISIGEYDSYIHISSNKEADFVGINHYRRYPYFLNQHKVLDSKVFFEPNEENLKFLTSQDQKNAALDLLKTFEVILSRPIHLSYNVEEQWKMAHSIQAFDIMREELTKTELSESLGYFDHNNLHIFAYHLITKWEILKEFTDFYIKFINKLVGREDFLTILNSDIETHPRFINKRLLSFIGERLVPLWVFHKRLKSAHIPCIVTEKDA